MNATNNCLGHKQKTTIVKFPFLFSTSEDVENRDMIPFYTLCWWWKSKNVNV